MQIRLTYGQVWSRFLDKTLNKILCWCFSLLCIHKRTRGTSEIWFYLNHEETIWKILKDYRKYTSGVIAPKALGATINKHLPAKHPQSHHKMHIYMSLQYFIYTKYSCRYLISTYITLLKSVTVPEIATLDDVPKNTMSLFL